MKPIGVMANRCRAAGVFPGEIAGASLKLVPPRGLDRGPPAVFPGEIAGASLKRGARPRPSGSHHVFPGEIAGASLKRRVRLTPRATCCAFSPAKSPGPH